MTLWDTLFVVSIIALYVNGAISLWATGGILIGWAAVVGLYETYIEYG